MPRSPTDRFFKTYPPEYIRKEADKWDAVADAAEGEGDKIHAEQARHSANLLRRRARECEIDSKE
jgi:hypothetical protein